MVRVDVPLKTFQASFVESGRGGGICPYPHFETWISDQTPFAACIMQTLHPRGSRKVYIYCVIIHSRGQWRWDWAINMSKSGSVDCCSLVEYVCICTRQYNGRHIQHVSNVETGQAAPAATAGRGSRVSHAVSVMISGRRNLVPIRGKKKICMCHYSPDLRPPGD